MIDLTKLSKEVIDAVRAATSLDELTQVQNRFLGKKSQIVKAKNWDQSPKTKEQLLGKR